MFSARQDLKEKEVRLCVVVCYYFFLITVIGKTDKLSSVQALLQASKRNRDLWS